MVSSCILQGRCPWAGPNASTAPPWNFQKKKNSIGLFWSWKMKIGPMCMLSNDQNQTGTWAFWFKWSIFDDFHTSGFNEPLLQILSNLLQLWGTSSQGYKLLKALLYVKVHGRTAPPFLMPRHTYLSSSLFHKPDPSCFTFIGPGLWKLEMPYFQTATPNSQPDQLHLMAIWQLYWRIATATHTACHVTGCPWWWCRLSFPCHVTSSPYDSNMHCPSCSKILLWRRSAPQHTCPGCTHRATWWVNGTLHFFHNTVFFPLLTSCHKSPTVA